jgi:hypothetical protein
METVIGYALAVSVTAIISMISFWLIKSKNYIAREEVEKIVEDKLKFINAEFAHSQIGVGELKNLLKDTIEVIGDLKLELRTLKVVLDNVVVQQAKYEQILANHTGK